ncbi:MAG: septum site-determining protein MinC [Actinomycetota bacterium]
MTPDASLSAAVSPVSTPTPEASPNLQVRFKSEEGRLLLFLPPETTHDSANSLSSTWSEIWQQLKHRLNAGERFWQPNTEVYLMAADKLLDIRQLQAIAEALSEVDLQLKQVHTTRRQTAVAAATVGYSVDQHTSPTSLTPSAQPAKALADPLYLQMTVRSGVEIRHPGTVVILGDLNPGGSVVAEGDILVWGRLRGTVHAGAGGNAKSVIMTLQMEPTLIRIANLLARGPETPPAQFYPEVAYITPQGIRISRATDFAKAQISSNG